MAQLFHLNSTFLSGLAFVFQFVVAQHFCQLKTGESQEVIGLDDWRHLCVQCLTEVVSPSGVQRCCRNRWGGGNGVLATVETWIDSISRWKCQHGKWRVEHLIATLHSTTRFFYVFLEWPVSDTGNRCLPMFVFKTSEISLCFPDGCIRIHFSGCCFCSLAPSRDKMIQS